MSLDLFRVIGGVDVQSDDLSSNAYILQGTGLPGGDANVQDGGPIGSMYMRTDVETNNLQLYYKWSTANNSAADWKVTSDKDYVDAVAQGLSWREPVRVQDTTPYANAAAIPTTGIIDGVTLIVGDRVLFSNITLTTDQNIFTWDGTTWTEDPNQESSGDAVLVQDGTHAEEQWVYDGITWVQFGSAAGFAELGFLRAFTGKTGPGSELPSYTSTDVITQSDNLEIAVGKLDNAMGTGEILNDGGNNAISGDMVWGAAGSLEVTDALNDLNNAIGDRTYTNDNVVVDGETVASSIDAIDTAIGSLQNQGLTLVGNSIDATAGITLDTIPLLIATESKWIIQVRQTSTPANRRSLEVHSMNDGVALIDHTEYAILKLGSNIPGFNIDVDISGVDMRLRLTATGNIDYVIRRVAFTSF